MNKAVIFTVLFLSTTVGSYGQWYNKKYAVHDINLLTKEQMQESLADAKGGMLAGGILAVCGGLLIWAGDETIKNGLPEDATIIEQIFGAEFMGKTYIVLGIGSIAGGTITTVCFFGRFERIRSAMKNNYGPQGSLKISPAVILYGNAPSATVGVSVKYKF